ncbi:hypothetical protein WA026_011760 [Henosepilachna vigintioctopunctata]|uniref:Uncharacterized protein n=1 Tax=Henosepilachna vigintioctopunctata TaxID=420089 RepID=A0AAW1UI51_9CUCU
MFRFKFLRNIIRRHTRPIPEDNASKWKRRLSLAYMILAWNAFGLVCYQIYIGKSDWAEYHGLKTEEELQLTPAQSWAKTLGIKNAQVIRISGLNVTHYEIKNGNNKTNELKMENTCE